MSFLDKLVGALAPPESDEDRAEARRKAESLTSGNDWLASALVHHRQIEDCFERARSAADPMGRTTAMKQLATILTAHSNAEESVLYPALVTHGHKVHATEAYQEQAMAKIQMAELERIDPQSKEWQDKLEHVRGAVLHHIYEEEKDWFPEIVRDGRPGDKVMLDQRFIQEFDRYMNGAESGSLARA